MTRYNHDHRHTRQPLQTVRTWVTFLKGIAAASERYARGHNKASGELLVRHLQEEEAKQKKPDSRQA